LPKKYLFSFILAAIGFGIASSIILNYLCGSYFYVLLLPCITAFAIGAVYAYVELNPLHQNVIVKIFRLLLPVCIVLLGLQQFGHKLFLIRAVYSVISINIIIYVTKQKYSRVTGFILNNKFLINVGKVSYGIYLYHYVLPRYYYQLLNYIQLKAHLGARTLKILSNPPPAYFIQLLILAVIAILSYKYIEVPFLKLKKYFKYSSKKSVAPQPAAL